MTQRSERNRMHTANLAIVFGPTLLWAPAEQAHNIAIDCIQQNNVVDILLNEFKEIFTDDNPKSKKKAWLLLNRLSRNDNWAPNVILFFHRLPIDVASGFYQVVTTLKLNHLFEIALVTTYFLIEIYVFWIEKWSGLYFE